jgi:hypothetical protein
MTLELNERDRIKWAEGMFMVYALGNIAPERILMCAD